MNGQSSSQLLRPYTPIATNIPLQCKQKIPHKELLLPSMGKCVCQITCGKHCLNRRTNVECSKLNCRAIGCTNTKIQRGQCEGLEVFNTNSERGMGLRCRQAIQKGTFIIQYVGEIFDRENKQGKERWESNLENKVLYMMRMSKEVYVDASRYGNLSRFINHSCQPNSVVQVWQLDAKYRLAVFANRDIDPLEEITYHYGKNSWISSQCLCGSAKCLSQQCPSPSTLPSPPIPLPPCVSATITFPDRYLPLLQQHLSYSPHNLTIQLKSIPAQDIVCYKYQPACDQEIVVTGESQQSIREFFEWVCELRREMGHIVVRMDLERLGKVIRVLEEESKGRGEFMYQVGQPEGRDDCVELFLIGDTNRIQDIYNRII